ncbi:Acg family FMN-binding oxidoreductase [Actinoplanes sp. NPDC049681]|uniref:Acg family FMN-binding oxidoreductase n=1 Tax=Actinoplanes sp. NPDC049681 TaxID=3363905 RepID=UPI0037B5ED0C
MPAARPTDLMRALAEAARLAQRAPSVFNTQPWRWRVRSNALELLREPDRTLAVTDPGGRQLLLSCGAALHHARLGLTAAGRRIAVTRFPDPASPDLLARIDVRGRAEPDDRVRRLRGAVPRRRTDRRPFGATPVPEAALRRLREAAQVEGTALHLLSRDQVPALATAATNAAAAEQADPAYRRALDEWTHRPPGSGDGVPAGTAVPAGPRAVPVRDFAPGGTPGLAIGPGDDSGTAYAVLYGPGDTAVEWLRAGEALSAVLLTAVVEGLGAAPMSDVLEVGESRRMVRSLLPEGRPYLALRIGVPVAAEAPPPTPRRRPGTVIS